jgi:hypothetical protein
MHCWNNKKTTLWGGLFTSSILPNTPSANALYFLCCMFPQRSAQPIADSICQRCYRFRGHPCKEQAEAHIDGKIECDIYRLTHTGAIETIIKEYIQGLHDQKLPHDQSKALFPQELRKFVAK